MFPDHATDSPWGRVEPLITPQKLKLNHLFGIDLVSKVKDSVTGKYQKLTDEDLIQIIERAISIVEEETQLDIMPVQRNEKYQYDANEYKAYGYMLLNHRPIASIEKLAISPANNVDVYTVPIEWIETAHLPLGQLFLAPLGLTVTGSGPMATSGTASSAGAALMFSMLSNRWAPAYWRVEYTTGFPNGSIPRIMNELIGVQAAIEVLNLLAATHAGASSFSLGIDGLSQSVSTPGPNIYDVRIKSLQDKKDAIVKQLKAHWGLNFFVSSL